MIWLIYIIDRAEFPLLIVVCYRKLQNGESFIWDISPMGFSKHKWELSFLSSEK
jgi:hypothetical protein